ncbi:dual specificity protein kinase yak1 [Tulasnella sp. 332]|nr:dual specificity protein kinase yak1 [Tulasnella sp. 332]
METSDGFDLPRFNVGQAACKSLASTAPASEMSYWQATHPLPVHIWNIPKDPIYNTEVSTGTARGHRRVSSLISNEQSLQPGATEASPTTLNRTSSLSSFYNPALGPYRQQDASQPPPPPSHQQLQPGYPADSYPAQDYSAAYGPRTSYSQTTAANRVTTLSPRSSQRRPPPVSPSTNTSMDPPSYGVQQQQQHSNVMYGGSSGGGHDGYIQPPGLDATTLNDPPSPSPSTGNSYSQYQNQHSQQPRSQQQQQSAHQHPSLDMYAQHPGNLSRSASSTLHSSSRPPIASPSTPMSHRQYQQQAPSLLQPQHTSSQGYYPQQPMEQQQPPPSRKQNGLRRIRDARDLRPETQPRGDGRRMDAETGLYMSPLNRLTKNISQTYNWCNPQFTYEMAHNPRRVLTKPSKPSHNDGYDNEDYDYILYVNDWLGAEDGRNKYLILDVLGQGTFGQVVKCQNMKTHQIVAVKVVKNKPAYFNQSMMEVKILQQLNDKWDVDDQHHILRLKETFIHKNHLCLVFELLSSNLYELIKQNQFGGLSTQLVKVFTSQLLDSLTVLKEARLIHCDLKPENILLKSLQSPQIKVIDFGSACFEGETVYTYIQSRFYRSPEVLLGLSYSAAIDMWSLGCIAVELFLGLPLFPGTSEYNQITRIVEMLGMPPLEMLERGKQSRNFFYEYQDEYGKHWRLKSIEQYSRDRNENEQPGKKYFAHSKLPEIIKSAPLQKSSSKNGADVDKACSADQAYPPAEMQHRAAFIDFVSGLLNLNPEERWTPQQARLHPFITGEKFVKPFLPPPAYVSNGRHSSASMSSGRTLVAEVSVTNTKQPYGGLVPQPPKGERAYADAGVYQQRLAQQQIYAAQQAQAQAAANASRNPYAAPAAASNPQQPQYTGSTVPQSGYGPSAYVAPTGNGYDTRGPGQIPLDSYPQSSQPRVQGTHSALPGGYAVANQGQPSSQNPHPPTSAYYPPSTRTRSNTIGQGEPIPAHLARAHPHLDPETGMTGRNMTPKLNREDPLREWERRQADGGRMANGPAYPQLEHLEQQAQQGRWAGSMSGYPQQGAQASAYTRYAPTQPSSLAQQFQSPPAAVVIDTQDKSNSALRDVAMSSVRAAAGVGQLGSSGRYDLSQNANAPAPPQPTYAAGSSSGRYAASGGSQPYQTPQQQQAPSFDSFDHRDGLATLYAPMQPNSYSGYGGGGSQSQVPSSPQTAQRGQSFYGSAVVSAGGANNFSPPVQQGPASTKDSRRPSGMDREKTKVSIDQQSRGVPRFFCRSTIMSDLAKSAMSARIAKLPHLPDIPPPIRSPYADADEDEGDEDEENEDGLGELPGATLKSNASSGSGRLRGNSQSDLSEFAPISAANYFAQAILVPVPESGLEYRVHYTAPTPGGSSTSREPDDQSTTTVLICHHGAGYSGLSFACFAEEVTRLSNGELGVLAIDARSHGLSSQVTNGFGKTAAVVQNKNESNHPEESFEETAVDLSMETLTLDFTNLVKAVFPKVAKAPSLLLLGHSMGGTVLVRASPVLQEAKYKISGVIVLDVVEGSALEAMPMMRGLLGSRPTGFDSVEEAVQWHVLNKTIRNQTSARVSVPSLFKPSTSAASEFGLIWRTPLRLTEPYWSGWFTGLSASFLTARTARLLILAGTDRLDKPLMIGQMQGKFQLEVVPNVGHMLHEDNPTKVAEIVVEFWKRNERLVLPAGIKVRKVGEA